MDYTSKAYKVFEMFDKQWALVSAGTVDHYNSCTVSWGSLGNIWGQVNEHKTRHIVTVYVHPMRYTSEFLLNNDMFTVSFYDEKYRKELAYFGTVSGKDKDKANETGFTPKEVNGTVTFEQANLTFVCKKLYQQQMDKNAIDPSVQQYYSAKAEKYSDFNGGWQPHYMFIGEIIAVEEK